MKTQDDFVAFLYSLLSDCSCCCRLRSHTSTHAAPPFPISLSLSAVVEDGLKETFGSASVTVVDCPDLREAPFSLAAPGAASCACSRPLLPVSRAVAKRECL